MTSACQRAPYETPVGLKRYTVDVDVPSMEFAPLEPYDTSVSTGGVTPFIVVVAHELNAMSRTPNVATPVTGAGAFSGPHTSVKLRTPATVETSWNHEMPRLESVTHTLRESAENTPYGAVRGDDPTVLVPPTSRLPRHRITPRCVDQLYAAASPTPPAASDPASATPTKLPVFCDVAKRWPLEMERPRKLPTSLSLGSLAMLGVKSTPPPWRVKNSMPPSPAA